LCHQFNVLKGVFRYLKRGCVGRQNRSERVTMVSASLLIGQFDEAFVEFVKGLK